MNPVILLVQSRVCKCLFSCSEHGQGLNRLPATVHGREKFNICSAAQSQSSRWAVAKEEEIEKLMNRVKKEVPFFALETLIESSTWDLFAWTLSLLSKCKEMVEFRWAKFKRNPKGKHRNRELLVERESIEKAKVPRELTRFIAWNVLLKNGWNLCLDWIFGFDLDPSKKERKIKENQTKPKLIQPEQWEINLFPSIIPVAGWHLHLLFGRTDVILQGRRYDDNSSWERIRVGQSSSVCSHV